MHNILHRNLNSYISPNPSLVYGEFINDDDMSQFKNSFPRLSGIGGHRVNVATLNNSISNNDFVFTFLRDPIHRFISHLNWQNHIIGHNWTLDSFSAYKPFHNFQCYRISGKRDFHSTKEIIENKFDFVGLVEQYDLSLLILREKLSGLFNTKYELSNKKRYPEGSYYAWKNLSDNQKELVIDCNREDIALYEYVAKNLFPTYQKDHPKTEALLSTFQSENEHYTFPRKLILSRKLKNLYTRRFVQSKMRKRSNKEIEDQYY